MRFEQPLRSCSGLNKRRSIADQGGLSALVVRQQGSALGTQRVPRNLRLFERFYKYVGVAIANDAQAIRLEHKRRAFFDRKSHHARTSAFPADHGVEPLIVAKQPGEPFKTSTPTVEMLFDDGIG